MPDIKLKEKGLVEILIDEDNKLRKAMGETEKDIDHLVQFNEKRGLENTECLTSLINIMNIRKGQRDLIEKIFNALRDLKGKL